MLTNWIFRVITKLRRRMLRGKTVRICWDPSAEAPSRDKRSPLRVRY
jgi:hypothetical protein